MLFGGKRVFSAHCLSRSKCTTSLGVADVLELVCCIKEYFQHSVWPCPRMVELPCPSFWHCWVMQPTQACVGHHGITYHKTPFDVLACCWTFVYALDNVFVSVSTYLGTSCSASPVLYITSTGSLDFATKHQKKGESWMLEL